MNHNNGIKTAILVDGGFYRRRAYACRQFDSCKIIIIPNVAYVALFLCQIFFLFCCTDVVRRCNIWYNSCI